MDHFTVFITIYHQLFPTCDIEKCLRIAGREQAIRSINEAYQILNQRKNTSLNYKIEALLTVAGRILLLQPFVDGNHRLASEFVSSYLKQEGYFLSSSKILEEQMLPLFYHPKEKIQKEKVKTLRKNLTRISVCEIHKS